MAEIFQATPFLYVRDLEAAVGFFAALGFEARVRMQGYAYLAAAASPGPGRAVRLLEASDAPLHDRTRKLTAVYVDVDDVDATHEALKPKLAALPADDVEGPVDRFYGQRELWIAMPDGRWVVFASPL